MGEELPESVYLELGKLIWDLIYLEDISRSLLVPIVDGSRFSSLDRLIEKALRELDPNQHLDGIVRAKEWLGSVKKLLPIRNAIVHGTQCYFYPTLEDIKRHSSETPQVIEHVDKKGNLTRIEMNREYLADLRERISTLSGEWVDVCLKLSESLKLLKTD